MFRGILITYLEFCSSKNLANKQSIIIIIVISASSSLPCGIERFEKKKKTIKKMRVESG